MELLQFYYSVVRQETRRHRRRFREVVITLDDPSLSRRLPTLCIKFRARTQNQDSPRSVLSVLERYRDVFLRTGRLASAGGAGRPRYSRRDARATVCESNSSVPAFSSFGWGFPSVLTFLADGLRESWRRQQGSCCEFAADHQHEQWRQLRQPVFQSAKQRGLGTIWAGASYLCGLLPVSVRWDHVSDDTGDQFAIHERACRQV